MERQQIEEPKNGNALALMFEMQKSLLEYYTVIENMPVYPLDINKRENQKFLKDLGRRLIEELAEAYSEIYCVLKCAEENNLEEALNHLSRFNMEIGDAWHFLIEFMIFIGWTPETVNTVINQNSDTVRSPKDQLHNLDFFAGFENQKENTAFQANHPSNYRILPALTEVDNRELLGGRFIGPITIHVHEQLLWKCTYTLNVCLNQLSNREHHQTEKIANSIIFEEKFFDFLIMFYRYMNFINKSPYSIYLSYSIANKKNQDRIKNSY